MRVTLITTEGRSSLAVWLLGAALLVLLSLLGSTMMLNGKAPRPAGGVVSVSEPQDVLLDRFGGVPVQVGQATGFFRVKKIGNRWMFLTPKGNPFWLRAVYAVSPMDGGTEYAEALHAKYGTPGGPFAWFTFAAQCVRRMRSWGFNALGEYSSEYTYPVPTYGRAQHNVEQMPFIRLIRVGMESMRNRWGWAPQPVKDVIYGTDRAIYTSYRPQLPDVFDPNFAITALANATDKETASWRPPFSQGLANIPWLIGTTPDDTDSLGGFRRDTDAHIGWLVAVTAPTQTHNTESNIAYADTSVFSKQAWRNYLVDKYGTIEALNATWRSTYTTFDSHGGWPNGRGLMDESGRNPWMGKDYVSLSTTAPGAREDLDAFLEQFAEQYFFTVASAIRSASPNNLVFGPAWLQRPRIALSRAVARHVDVVQVSIEPGQWANLEAITQDMYARFGKPMFFWLTAIGQGDSPLASFPASNWRDMVAWTQAGRWQIYADLVQRLWNFRASDGTYPVVGINWWEWTDKVTHGEHVNFGLVTNRDNAYDGREAARATGKDAWGYLVGGEDGDYGNFLSAVRRTNSTIDRLLFFEVLKRSRRTRWEILEEGRSENIRIGLASSQFGELCFAGVKPAVDTKPE